MCVGNESMKNVRNFLEEIKVYDCGLTKIRLGNEADGGYIVLKEICERTDVLCSCGIGNDISFESDFVDRFSDTYGLLFDHTIDEIPMKHKNLIFRKQKINSTWNSFYEVPKNSLLKMDIECDEWDVFSKMELATLMKFNQVVCEFHVIHVESRSGLSPYFHEFYQNVLDKINADLFDMYYRVMEKLNSFFYIFHIHANNSLPMIAVGGYQFPPLLELSFVRKDLVHDISSILPLEVGANAQFPVVGLDFPNKLDRQDIVDYYPFKTEG